eukprot:15250571-Heterocapsa_arctica.AAC.1
MGAVEQAEELLCGRGQLGRVVQPGFLGHHRRHTPQGRSFPQLHDQVVAEQEHDVHQGNTDRWAQEEDGRCGWTRRTEDQAACTWKTLSQQGWSSIIERCADRRTEGRLATASGNFPGPGRPVHAAMGPGSGKHGEPVGPEP